MHGGEDIGIIHHFKRSREGYLNKIELLYDKKKGPYIRKRFNAGFFAGCYPDIFVIAIGILLGLRPQSGKSRKQTEEKKYKEFNRLGFPVPKLLEEGDCYLDIEYIKMTELSRLLRDRNESKQRKLDVVRKAAAGIRKIHDAGLEIGDANVHNIGFTPDGRIVFFDFEHKLIKGSREKDYSTFARSAAHEISKSSDVKDVLRSAAQGYGEDMTRKIRIMPWTYLVFFVEKKLKNLYELRKARRYGIGR